jgi:hypothetical protein
MEAALMILLDPMHRASFRKRATKLGPSGSGSESESESESWSESESEYGTCYRGVGELVVT